jgi:DNA-binding transcriptional regulator YdaS (Cro superfamily)
MNKLQLYLETNNVARRDFADLIGVDQSVLSRFCRSLARPGLDKAVAIERLTDGAVPASSWVHAPDPSPLPPPNEAA